MRVATIAFMAVALAAAVSIGRPASAQELERPYPRQGYYLGVGMLGGANHNWEDGDSLGAWGGNGVAIRLGQMLTRRLGLGLQIYAGGSKKGQEQATAFGLGLEGQMAVMPRLALHAGVGLGVLQLEDRRIENEDLRGTYGAEYLLGLSYSFFPYKRRPSGGLSVTPMVQGRLLPGDNATALNALVGVELAWWTGLPRNQLDLPPADAYERR